MMGNIDKNGENCRKMRYNDGEEFFSRTGDNTNKETCKNGGIVQIGGK